ALQLPRACATAPSAVQRRPPHHCNLPRPGIAASPVCAMASPSLPRQRLLRSHGSFSLAPTAASPSVARRLSPLGCAATLLCCTALGCTASLPPPRHKAALAVAGTPEPFPSPARGVQPGKRASERVSSRAGRSQ